MQSPTLVSFVERLFAAIPGQWEKVIVSALLVVLALLGSHLWARYLARGEMSAEKRRLHLVWARNIIWLAVLLVIVSVWASTIAGFALSLAAVAGALLIVSKELVMCVHGYLYVSVVQPYKVGDAIEFGALRGRVIDIDMFATTLAELDASGQQTGKVAEFPNGLLLTTPLKNTSPTGAYQLHHIRMPVPEALADDLDRIEAAALAAADRAIAPWRDDAIAHFRKVSDEHFIAFPSGRTKVSWDFSDPEHLVLVVRVACPSLERHAVEQAVFRDTWRALVRPSSAPAA
jgi:small-conductance mechanosensitive channel